MYAIVEIAGQQFKVENNQKLFVHRLEGAEGDSISFDRVLLTDNDGQVNIGTPTVEAALISAKILKHLKGDKVIVFKKKRRKGYAVKNGHRQLLTQIQIEAISLEAEKEKTEKTEKPKKAKRTKKEEKVEAEIENIKAVEVEIENNETVEVKIENSEVVDVEIGTGETAEMEIENSEAAE